MHARPFVQRDDRRAIARVLLIGVLSGVLYLAVYYLQRAIFLNGRMPDVIDVTVGVPASRTRLFVQMAGYGGATLALFGLYTWLLLICRQGGLRGTRACALALSFPVLFNLGLILGRPYLSTDVFSYLAHGYLGTAPGRNPYTDPTRDVAGTEFALKIIPWGWKPETHDVSPYGPLWTQLEIGVVRLTDQVSIQLLLLKAVVVAASLISAALIWVILGRVRPEDRLLGTLLFLWNPMAIIEFAAEGHNDALMIVFVLLGILFAVRAFPAGSLVALMLGILTKYLPVLFLPAHLLYFWRARVPSGPSRRRLAIELAMGGAASLAIAVLLYWSLWVGPATLQGVRGQGQARFIASTSMAIFVALQGWLSEPEAARWASRIVTAIFGIVLLVISARVRDVVELIEACGRIALAYLLVASPAYWPWYAALPLALMALSPQGILFWMCIVLTFCSRVVAPMSDITVNGFTSWSVEVWSTTVIGLFVPLLSLALLAAWRRGTAPVGPLPTT